MINRKIKVFANLKNTNEVNLRMLTEGRNLPGWFGLPIKRTGAGLVLHKAPYIQIFKELLKGRSEVVLLIFNPSIHYFILSILPLPIKRIALYQWRPIGRLVWLKNIAVYLILKRANSILVYSFVAFRYIRRHIKPINLTILNLYTDTCYFKPGDKSNKETFILVPGDHLRDEKCLIMLSKKLQIPIKRVTRNPKVKSEIEKTQYGGIQLLFDIPFESLKKMYQTAGLVLILSDSSEIPSGITSLCEALACGCDVVVTKGQSNVGICNSNSEVPYKIVRRNLEPLELLEEIKGVLANGFKAYNPRRYSVQCLSEKKVTLQWQQILNELFSEY